MSIDLLHWRPRGLSWSMWKRIMDCPKQAEFAVRDRLGDPSAAREQTTPTYHADAGTIVQKLYELYFNQGVNLRSGGTSPEAVAKACRKVLESKWAREIIAATTYPRGKSEGTLRQLITSAAASGRQALFDAGLLEKAVRSEVPTPGEVDGFPVFSLIDFLVETPQGDYIYDGKVNAAATADPRQLWYAALARGRPVLGGGFVYWRLGKFVPVPMGADAVEKFRRGEFAEGRERWEPVMGPGVEELDPTPKFSSCRWCAWNGKCASAQTSKQKPINYDLPEEIGWGDLE